MENDTGLQITIFPFCRHEKNSPESLKKFHKQKTINKKFTTNPTFPWLTKFCDYLCKKEYVGSNFFFLFELKSHGILWA